MSALEVVLAALVVLLVIVPALVGLAFDKVRANRSSPALLTANTAKAQATLSYFNDVHDSHSG